MSVNHGSLYRSAEDEAYGEGGRWEQVLFSSLKLSFLPISDPWRMHNKNVE